MDQRVKSILIYVGILLCCSKATRVEVYTQEELIEALNDPQVDHVVMMPIPPTGWLFNNKELPEKSVKITNNRTVLLEGEPGSNIYVDGNQLPKRVLVDNGSLLRQKGLWVDDCFGPTVPYTCFAQVLGNHSALTVEDFVMSDATCIKYSDSLAIGIMLYSVRIGATLPTNISHVDSRTVHIDDTGWVDYPTPPNAKWRFLNVSLSCTGNVTHPLESTSRHWLDGGALSTKEKSSIAVTFLLGLMTFVYWYFKRQGLLFANEQFKLDYKIALKKGYLLKQLVCVSNESFGSRLYKGVDIKTKQLVALKVFTMAANNKEENLAATAECTLLSTLGSHKNCVQLLNSFSCLFERRPVPKYKSRPPSSSSSGSTWREKATRYTLKNIRDPTSIARDLSSLGSIVSSYIFNSSDSSSKLGSEKTTSFYNNKGGIQPPDTPSESEEEEEDYPSSDMDRSRGGVSASMSSDLDSSNQGSGGMSLFTSTSHSYKESLKVPVMQTYFVLEYCDRGTLNQAVVKGMFRGKNGSANLKHIIETALDIARGLEFLHGPSRRVVHRDLTPRNILLSTAKNNRGFEAKLCDFGLSMVIPSDVTHRTAGIKGAVAYMPPELFQEDCVSLYLDVYSLGAILYFLMAGIEPYHGVSASAIIKHKLSGRQDEFVFDAAMTGVLHSDYQRIVLQCTHPDRHQRPSASEVVQCLENMQKLL